MTLPLSFEELVHQLDMRRAGEDQQRFLLHWLASAEPDDLGLTLGLLLQRPTGARITIPALKKALFTRINQDLFEASKKAATDLSETLALLWPGGTDKGDLHAMTTALGEPTPAKRLNGVAHVLDQSNALARDLVVRLCTGRFKSPITPGTLRAALAIHFDRSLSEVEQNLANAGSSLDPFVLWLQGETFPQDLTTKTGFLSIPPFQYLDIKDADQPWLAVPRGTILELIVRERGSTFLTIEGDPAHEPATALGLPSETTFLVFGPANPDYPVLLLDILMKDGEDLTPHSYSERIKALEALKPAPQSPRVELACLGKSAPSFEEPATDRLLLAPTDQGMSWCEIHRPDYSFCLVALYVEGALTRDGHFTGDVTLGAMISAPGGANTRDLVPVGKAPAANLGASDTGLLNAFIAENTLERFGPVRKLKSGEDACLILRVACRAIDPATRRKAGLVLAEARLVEILDNSPSPNVSALDELRLLALL
jgi:DNA ligase-1